ncbi:MAG: glycosyltransferase family A protein [Pseudomonadota bacterium]
MSTLSIVIICKNEEKHIKNTIESVLLATKKETVTEIILVDSASTDNTINIAKKFPIKIVQIQAEYYMSPAAGRHIGFRYCTGDYVFFLDGDMLLDKNWFSAAMPLMDKDPKLAAVAGLCEGMGYSYFGNTTHLGGAVLYRYCVLVDPDIGNFQPYLCNEEELELGFRISAAGFYLQRIEQKMTIHCTDGYYSQENASGITLKSIKRDWTTGRYIALGQVLRLLWHNPFRSHYLDIFKRALALIPIYLCGIIALIVSFYHATLLYFLIWLIPFISLFLARAIWKKDFFDTLLFFIDNSFSAMGFIVGWLRPTLKAADYQPRVIEIQ